MSIPSQLKPLCAEFLMEGSAISAEPVHTGHINTTWRIGCRAVGDSRARRYILQSINLSVFPSPLAVMHNVTKVTRHLRQSAATRANGRSGSTLALVPTRAEEFWLTTSAGDVWRCYEYVEDCVTHDVVSHTTQAREAARAFGNFLYLVSDLPPHTLLETIPAFHDTHRRFLHLMKAVENNPLNRVGTASPEIEFVRDRAARTRTLSDAMADGIIPIRVVHNDTKINNVMFHEKTGHAECVIDLDTVMPGLAVHDFGDLVRSSVSESTEDERDLTRIRPRMDVFESLVQGYLEGAGDVITDAEVEHLVTGCHLMTLEVGMRFLTDHLEGDVYFRTHRENHNLDRARAQFKLVEELEHHETSLRATVERHRNRRSPAHASDQAPARQPS